MIPQRLSFELPGKPQAWQRPGTNKCGGRSNLDATRDYEARVRQVAGLEAMRQGVSLPMKGPVAFRGYYVLPARSGALSVPTLSGSKPDPDADNLVKCVSDGLNAGVLDDDVQVAVLHAEKWRGPIGAEGSAHITIIGAQDQARCEHCNSRLWT